MTKTMLFNPYTGKPRDPRDIASDPAGILMVDPDEPLLAAALSAQPQEASPYQRRVITPTEYDQVMARAELAEKTLAVVREELRKSQPPSAPKAETPEQVSLRLHGERQRAEPQGLTFWYMRDNHTFRKLSGTPQEMVAQCLEEFDAGWNSGMLCASDEYLNVHAHYSDRDKFEREALAALASRASAGKEQP